MPKSAPAFVIYHNPRCSKSRATLERLQGRGVEVQIIEYLRAPPTVAELKSVLKKLGMKPAALVRKSEDIFKQKYAGKTLSDAQWLDALAKDPILIERPIVIRGERVVLGRPPENVDDL
jgi:arsenate reductase